MKYDFDRMPDRSNTASLKWDRNFRMGHVRYDGEVNSMWVADMDFPCAKPIVSAIEKRAAHPVYGYSLFDRDKVPGAICNWISKRYGWSPACNDVLVAPGVVTSLGVAVSEFTEPGDGIIIQTPVYYPFRKTIEAAGRRVVVNPLICHGGRYSMDFADLEAMVMDPANKLMILCSPHNPVGRVWTEQELHEVGRLCSENDVLLVSDEIHIDITRDGTEFTPAALAGDRMNTITLTAPSKTFNIPGLAISVVIIENQELKERWKNRAYGILSLGMTNPLSAEAYIAAYDNGAEWLEQVSRYIDGNFRLLKECLQEKIPGMGFIIPEGTYLAWLDLGNAGVNDDMAFAKDLERLEGLLVDPGSIFGEEGRGFIRLNIACPARRVVAAVESIQRVLAKD
ncbi:MAG TPA: MalY/PatB family protein [Clostridia bacterium]|nr:MalY/PatB family protein [Clostridia bacterium]